MGFWVGVGMLRWLLVMGGPRADEEVEEAKKEVKIELAGRFSTLEHTSHLTEFPSLRVPHDAHSILF